MVIYRTDSNEIGPRGPIGAWLRLVPQELYINHVMEEVVSGDNALTWDGTDFEGNEAGSGSYEFDVLVINLKDSPTLVGPSTPGGAPFSETSIDIKSDPPEIWAHSNEDGSEYYRGTIGTDWIANPDAWEVWTAPFMDYEGVDIRMGQRPDDIDPDVFWNISSIGEKGGIYKSLIDRSTQSWELDPTFGDNGFFPNIHDRAFGGWPQGSFFIKSHWSLADVPVTAAEYHDKSSGEIVRSTSLNEYYLSVRQSNDGSLFFVGDGPGKIHANQHGAWMCTPRRLPIVHLDAEGNVVWSNHAGDGIGPRVSIEEAERFGVPATNGQQIHARGTGNGHGMFLSEVSTASGAFVAFLGRDGTGITELFVDPKVFPPSQNWSDRWLPSWELLVIDEGTAYDGLYYGSAMDLGNWNYGGSTRRAGAVMVGPGSMFHVPFGMAEGRMGPDVSVVEEVAGSVVPRHYSLSDAYPNPFNPKTTIEFSVPVAEHVRLDMFSAAGQLVVHLIDDELGAGSYKTVWEGINSSGDRVSSAVYFYRMQAGDFVDTRAVTLLK